VWNCPTYALDVLPERRAQLVAECRRIGRDPASLRVTEEAVLALVARREAVEPARAAALRRFDGPGWRFATHGYAGTPDDVLRRMEERARLGVDGVVFFLHDRGGTETIDLLAREIVPAARRF
jgi:alkanesulfonate monooxygenase SsuD/methylene tetrahydromethanopterin reductase-like flavin-dependent oxidoreductase (luciferase family)